MKDQERLLAEAQDAKEKARQIFSRFGPVNGVGLVRQEGRYAVRVNFASEPCDAGQLPVEIGGVPVVVRVIGPILKQATRST